MQAKIHPSWAEQLQAEFDKPYMVRLKEQLLAEKEAGNAIYPPAPLIFNAFNHTPFDQVRVVIVGQDPYHGPGQAMGLSFSVPPGERIPPSLRNIFKELQSDLRIAPPTHGDLTAWADRGVLLLNTTLTVRASEAASHSTYGWERLTDAAIRALNKEREHLVFMLWGRHAQCKGDLVDPRRHLRLQSNHPSPLSAHRGFFDSRPFSQANAYLIEHGYEPIDWALPESSDVS